MADPIQILRSRSDLRRVKGGRDGLYPFLENLTWDVVQYFDDFLGDEMRGSGAVPGIYEVVTGVDGDFTILANQANGVGQLAASVGVGANAEYCGLSLPELGFRADRNAVVAVRLQIDVITTVKVELGFTDVTTDAGAVNDKANATFTADNAAVWCYDTTDSGVGWEGMAVNSTNGQTTYEAGIATTPTAATYETLVVAIREDDSTNNEAAVRFLRLDDNQRLTHDSGWNAEYISSDVALVPWVFVQLRGAVDRNVNIDFIDVRGRRTAN